MEMSATADQVRGALRQLSLFDRLSIEQWLQALNEREARHSSVAEARAVYEMEDPVLMTLEEFLEFERRSPMRHEFVNGFVFAMTGGTRNHARITQNITSAFAAHLRRAGGPCEPFATTVKIVIKKGENKISYYPDVLIDCRRDARADDYLWEPRLIVEVLSPSTHLVDRREKLQNYRLIDSLEEYVLAAQDERKLTIYRRSDGWRGTHYCGLDSAAEFHSISLALPLSEIYDRVGEDGAAPVA